MFEQSDAAAEVAWRVAKSAMVLQGSLDKEMIEYNYLLLVRTTNNGRLVVKRIGTGRNRNLREFGLQTSCAFMTNEQLAAWQAQNNAVQL